MHPEQQVVFDYELYESDQDALHRFLGLTLLIAERFAKGAFNNNLSFTVGGWGCYLAVFLAVQLKLVDYYHLAFLALMEMLMANLG